jgi:hypothetical protein
MICMVLSGLNLSLVEPLAWKPLTCTYCPINQICTGRAPCAGKVSIADLFIMQSKLEILMHWLLSYRARPVKSLNTLYKTLISLKRCAHQVKTIN